METEIPLSSIGNTEPDFPETIFLKLPLQMGRSTKVLISLKRQAETHFQNLYKEDGVGCEEVTSDFLSHIPFLVSREDNSTLMKPFTEEEICNVIWSMEPDKAPGPDGFSIHFYRTCWEIIKTDLLRMIKAFQQKSKVGGSTNSTFLALIPKEVNLGSFDRFRPISLCNASYKIISKLMENRIKPLLGKLISPIQSGFVKGRHILGQCNSGARSHAFQSSMTGARDAHKARHGKCI
jgi:hypothetical protein